MSRDGLQKVRLISVAYSDIMADTTSYTQLVISAAKQVSVARLLHDLLPRSLLTNQLE